MTNYCQCGNELTGRQQYCTDCRKIKADLFYAYSSLRWELWERLNNPSVTHGLKIVKQIYTEMVDEEGDHWTREVLGDKLVNTILATI